ncbi:FtsK/SpoIIIE family DNA translocase [Falsiporphyromonas endometrii]|uniref:DNA translocase FtsK 4TM domain-containing protein n=1 Tax=Falsiporphyromonas endometrii TaxID=1387297 RepID=A0ABV9K544_9PORP
MTTNKESDKKKSNNKNTKKGKSVTSKDSHYKEANPDKKEGTFWKDFGTFLNKKVVRGFFGIVIMAISVFMLISVISFFFSGGHDQAVVSNLSDPSVDPTVEPIRNVGKALGACLSQWLINDLFGLGSLCLIAFVFMAGLDLFFLSGKDYLIKVLKRFAFYGFLCLWVSLLCGLIVDTLEPGSFIQWGGQNGLYLESWLRDRIGYLGIFLLLLIVLFALFLFVSEDNYNKLHGWLSFASPQKRAEMKESRRLRKAEKIAKKRLEEEKAELLDTKIDEASQASTVVDDKDDNLIVQIDDEEESFGGEPFMEQSSQAVQDDSSDLTNLVSDSLSQSHLEEEEPTYDTMDVKNHIIQDSEDNEVTQLEGDRVKDEDVMIEVAKGDEVCNDLNMEPQKPGQWVELRRYHLPSLDVLGPDEETVMEYDKAEIDQNKELIVSTLKSFKMPVRVEKVTVGPTITLYEVIPEAGIKISRIRSIEDDIAMSLKSEGIRIIAPMPGKGTIGIEVPNSQPSIVTLRSVLASKKYRESTMELPVAIGKTITNEVFMFDLAKMPHLLIAGATGQGKSVGLNAMIASLLFKKRPEELKFVLVDPKMLEFSLYEGMERHYLAMLPDATSPIVTDMSQVVPTLKSLCVLMDERYALLAAARVRNIKEYNTLFKEGKLPPNKKHHFMPYIVLIVDEFADLIMTSGKEVEMPIARIAQKARAAGIHMVIATQRPSTDIITGIIKANFPARIAFKVFSMIDSRTILDSPGANQLVGRGDMLFNQGKDTIRLQCAFMDTPENEQLVHEIAKQESFTSAYLLPDPPVENEAKDAPTADSLDDLFDEVARMVVSSQVGSTSNIQRRFNVGYNRAGRLMDQLEGAGIVSPQDGSKPRQVLIQDEGLLESLLIQIHG